MGTKMVNKSRMGIIVFILDGAKFFQEQSSVLDNPRPIIFALEKQQWRIINNKRNVAVDEEITTNNKKMVEMT